MGETRGKRGKGGGGRWGAEKSGFVRGGCSFCPAPFPVPTARQLKGKTRTWSVVVVLMLCGCEKGAEERY